MTAFVVKCPKCQSPLDAGLLNTHELQPCANCQTPVEAEVFPALFRKIGPGAEGERVMIEGEASCFYHPAKKAVQHCAGCGRFLCALCDCELRGVHYCPSCLEAGQKKGKIKNLENRRVLYDTIALGLTVGPLLPALTLIFVGFYFVSLFTTPAALFIAIRYWNAPRSIIHRTKARLVIAIILAVLQIALWIFIFANILINVHFNSNV
ncbi:MAG: hypothetical protein ACRETL_13175, partial [Gammaproteobacteria bacterium]